MRADAIVKASAPPGMRDLLTAAVAKLDAIVAGGLAPDAADRLNATIGLAEEAMSEPMPIAPPEPPSFNDSIPFEGAP